MYYYLLIILFNEFNEIENEMPMDKESEENENKNEGKFVHW